MLTKFCSLLCVLWLTLPGRGEELWERFPQIVRRDGCQMLDEPVRRGVRITYLGTNGYLLEAKGAVLLIDPYFSRMGLVRSLLKGRTKARPDLLQAWLAVTPRIDGVLVTHGHIDHLFDVPPILRERPATQLYAAPESIALARSTGAKLTQTHEVHPGSVIHIGSATVRVQHGTHDRVAGAIPFPGPARHTPPTHVDDWICGETLAYLIEIGGKRIYLAAGSAADDGLVAGLGHIDLAIQGVATPDAQTALPRILERLRPKYFLPSHLDNFFRPLDREFSFLPFTDFPRVRRTVAATGSKLILLDYFQPWTLR